MALRKIVLQGDECLTKVCRPVTEFNQRLHTLIDDMKETLLDSGGVGLAAPQVGVLRRVCVVMNEDEDIIELVNPEIIAAAHKALDEYGRVWRAASASPASSASSPAPIRCVSGRRTGTAIFSR